MTKTTAFIFTLRKSRYNRGECQGCGTSLETGYGLMGGDCGAYAFCPNRQCPEPDFFKWNDPEMDEHTSESQSDSVQTLNDDV